MKQERNGDKIAMI